MKIFGLTIGCPEAVGIAHCLHHKDTRVRPRRRHRPARCRQPVELYKVNQKRQECCRCRWVTPWIKAAYQGVW